MIQFQDKTGTSTLDAQALDHHKEVISVWSNGDVLLGVALIDRVVTLFWEEDKWVYTFPTASEAKDFYESFR